MAEGAAEQEAAAWWGSAPAELLLQIFACLPLRDRCLTACAVNAWWRQVALVGTATLLQDLNLNRMPLFAQRTRSLPDFFPQRASFITWLLARRSGIRRLALTAERWEDDSQAVMLRLAVAEIVAAQLQGLRLVCTDSGRTTSAFLAGGGRLQELALDFWGRSKGLPRALEDCTALTKLTVQCSGGLEQYRPLAALKSLQDLSVADCDWQKLPEELLQLPLTRLQLRFADFGSDSWLPAGLGGLRSTLRDLALPGCQLGAVPEGITALSALTALTLDRNFIRALPPCLAQLRCLQHLSCEGCSGLRELPPALAASLPLHRLNLLHTGVLRLPLAAGAARTLEAASSEEPDGQGASGSSGSSTRTPSIYLGQLTELCWGVAEWEAAAGGGSRRWVGPAGALATAAGLPDLAPVAQATALRRLHLAHVPAGTEAQLAALRARLPALTRLQVNSAVLLGT